MISIIVPTRNRANSLKMTIESIIQQDFPKEQFEMIIVDNKSTDNTRDIVNDAISKYSTHNIRYIFEDIEGLLSGRHRGVHESKGDIIVFIDDDIIVEEGWLNSIENAFKDKTIGAIGGRSFPIYESDPPFWLKAFFNPKKSKFIFGYYSLINLGEKPKMINPIYLWGLNMAFRKEIFYTVGGTNPDLMPEKYKQFTGDGESGFGFKLLRNNIKTLYVPTMRVRHHISKERLTIDYLKRRQFYQGTCDSYSKIRNNNNNKKKKQKFFEYLHFNLILILKRLINIIIFSKSEREIIKKINAEINESYRNGYEFHVNEVKKNPNLYKWIIKDNYFDYDYRKYL